MPDSKRKISPGPGTPPAKGKSTPSPAGSSASLESRLEAIDAKLSKLLDGSGGGTPNLSGSSTHATTLGKSARTDDNFDVFERTALRVSFFELR